MTYTIETTIDSHEIEADYFREEKSLVLFYRWATDGGSDKVVFATPVSGVQYIAVKPQ